MSKKILFLMEYPIDLAGGGQMSTQTLCEGLAAAESDFTPVVACPTLLTKEEADYPFRIVTYPSDENRELSKWSRIKNFLSRIGSFYRIIKDEKPDLIHVSMSESLISFGFLRCLGLFAKIPFVYTDRGLCYGYRKHSKMCIMATMKHAAMMLTTTNFNRKLWEEENLKCPITVIPNTIGKAFDDYDETRRPAVRRDYGIGEDELIIGFAGRISEEKDWPCVEGLVGALKAAGIEFRVALVLSVYEDRDAKIVDEIKSGIVKHIGEDNLIYMQDLTQREIADYYYLVDIFVMTSSFESFGKAAVEAMSRRCALVSTPVGGLREVIGKEENLYTKEDLSVFTGRIAELDADREMLDREREFYYNRYKTLYTRDVNVARHMDVYGGILKE